MKVNDTYRLSPHIFFTFISSLSSQSLQMSKSNIGNNGLFRTVLLIPINTDQLQNFIGRFYFFSIFPKFTNVKV